MLNKNTIINNKKIELSEDEQKGVTVFHKSRTAFAIIFDKNNNDYYLAFNKKDAREHRVYLKEDFGITDDKFENLIRGYIKPGKINFYISSFFKPIEIDILTEEIIRDLLLVAKEDFGIGEYEIGNGLIVGKPGGEWPSENIIAKYEINETEEINRIDGIVLNKSEF
ncbi:MAG: hypothetical protein PHH51_03990 [Bacilli bacterium]|nr:hypothetical protein [Bacilli bacterium]